MKQSIFKKTLTTLFLLGFFCLGQNVFSKQVGDSGWSDGVNILNGGTDFQGPGLSTKNSKTVTKNLLSWLTGILAVVFMTAIVASGLIMMFSIGDQGLLDTAKKWLTYSLIGLIVALSAFIIINTIGVKFLGMQNP